MLYINTTEIADYENIVQSWKDESDIADLLLNKNSVWVDVKPSTD